MDLEALQRQPGASRPMPGSKICPHLRPPPPITRPTHVWTMDIRDAPMARCFACLAAATGWAARRILARRDPQRRTRAPAAKRSGRPWRNTASRRSPAAAGAANHLHRRRRGLGRPRDQNQHGWNGCAARLRLRRKAVAEHHMRGGLPALPKPDPAGPDASPSTTGGVPIHRIAAERRMKPASLRRRLARRRRNRRGNHSVKALTPSRQTKPLSAPPRRRNGRSTRAAATAYWPALPAGGQRAPRLGGHSRLPQRSGPERGLPCSIRSGRALAVSAGQRSG